MKLTQNEWLTNTTYVPFKEIPLLRSPEVFQHLAIIIICIARNWIVTCHQVSNVFGMIGFYTPFVYLPSMAAQHPDIGVEDAAFLVSIIGVSNTFGRVKRDSCYGEWVVCGLEREWLPQNEIVLRTVVNKNKDCFNYI